MMFAVFGIPEKLWLRPVDQDNPQQYYEGFSAQTGVTMDCYHVCTFSASEWPGIGYPLPHIPAEHDWSPSESAGRAVASAPAIC